MQVIGIDFGDKRIGIAIGDTGIGLAIPQDVYINHSTSDAAGYIIGKAEETNAQVIVVGVPYSMSGKVGPQAALVISIVEQRLNKKRTRKKKFAIKTDGVDSSSAAVILQSWMDSRTIN